MSSNLGIIEQHSRDFRNIYFGVSKIDHNSQVKVFVKLEGLNLIPRDNIMARKNCFPKVVLDSTGVPNTYIEHIHNKHINNKCSEPIFKILIQKLKSVQYVTLYMYIIYIKIFSQNSISSRGSKYIYICINQFVYYYFYFFLKCGQGDDEILLNLHRNLAIIRGLGFKHIRPWYWLLLITQKEGKPIQSKLPTQMDFKNK